MNEQEVLTLLGRVGAVITEMAGTVYKYLAVLKVMIYHNFFDWREHQDLNLNTWFWRPESYH